jgi:hypothetical protein
VPNFLNYSLLMFHHKFLYKVLSIVIKSKRKIFWDHTVCSRASNKNWWTKKERKIHTYIPVCSSCLYIALYVFTIFFFAKASKLHACGPVCWRFIICMQKLDYNNRWSCYFFIGGSYRVMRLYVLNHFFYDTMVRFIFDTSVVDIIVSNGQ